MTQDPSAKARKLHRKLYGLHAEDCEDMCSEAIDHALREAEQRGFERGVEAGRAEFGLWGSDQCQNCMGGRVTLYARLPQTCIECALKPEREECDD